MSLPLLAVDIGNARMKVGAFGSIVGRALPEPMRTLALDGQSPSFNCLTSWLGDLVEKKETDSEHSETPVPFIWHVASVNRSNASRFIEWLRNNRPDDKITLLSAGDLPLTVRLQRPDMVGIDRLVDAVAVNRLREANRPAVIVDVGTAITVDMVSADGAFLGGAILPGLEMSARALHELTDLLPLLDISEFADPPPVLGTSTESAMRSGLYWGTVGAIRQLIEQLSCDTVLHPHAAKGTVPLSLPTIVPRWCPKSGLSPRIFLTGGAAATVAELLGPDAQYVPHLTLAGIALSGTGG
jgi:type III pantothenate kinase